MLMYLDNEAKQRKFADYQNDSSGANGVCKRCTKKLRDERYPLPKIPKDAPTSA